MISIESLLYWISVTATLGLTFYVVRQYARVLEHEKQVDRGWKDLIDRADKIIGELKEIKSQPTKIEKKVGRSKIK
jgi:hypothetical protein